MESINHEEEGYFALIQRVGSKGKYQRQVLLLFYLIWFVTAFLILSLSFILMPSRYLCPSIPNPQECKKWVCSLSDQDRNEYISAPQIGSLLHQFSQCEDEASVANYKMTLFFGIFMGYIFFSYFSDNFGRRRAMIMTWMTSLVGIMILCSSKSLEVASLGLFLAGAGCESNLRVNLTIINEIVDYHLRQVYSVILQSAFGVAGISIAVAYNLLYDWRIVTIFFCAIPAFIVMVIIFVSLEETPGHLSAQGSKKVLLSLQRIAAINGLECNITEEEVLIAMTVRIENDKIKASGRQLTLFDLFHYKSLRKKTLYLSLMLFFLASLYIGPNSVLETFKVDIFWLQVILSLPDCIVYPLTCHFIVNIERRKAGLKYLGLASVFLFLSIFFKSPEGCDFCIENIIKLTLLFFSRCCVSFYYGVLFVYIIQLYPEQVRNIGFGTVSAAGALGSTIVQKLLSYSKELNHNPLVYLLSFSIFCFIASYKLPETHGHPLQFQIEQLRKKRINKKYEPSLQESNCDLDLSSESERTESETNPAQNDNNTA